MHRLGGHVLGFSDAKSHPVPRGRRHVLRLLRRDILGGLIHEFEAAA
jgi:hypothetical protein